MATYSVRRVFTPIGITRDHRGQTLKFTMLYIVPLVIVCTLCPLAGHGSEKHLYPELESVPKADWRQLATKRIFFGHQSVGYNIVEGLHIILGNTPSIKLNIKEGESLPIFNEPVFAHARVGKNRNPLSKIEAFKNIILSESKRKIDIAILKFCFVDITSKTDIDSLFAAYTAMVEEIRQKRPGLKLVHCTVPLMVSNITWKTKLKNLLGMGSWELADNIQRNKYNALVRNKYGKKAIIFDIAQAESSDGNGAVTFTYNGNRYGMLNPAFSTDGGHLNKIGSIQVAEKLLLSLDRTMVISHGNDGPV